MNAKIEELYNQTNIILNRETSYSNNKEIIKNYFKDKQITGNLEDSNKLLIIKTRLILIDGVYSTNIGRNRFGLEDLAKAILQFKTDDNLKEECKNFLDSKNKNSKIFMLFHNKYGFKKTIGAMSLISKYLYFLTEFQFPIYDSVVKDQIKYSGKDILKYIERVQVIMNKLGLDDYDDKDDKYDKFDQLFWVKGKIELVWDNKKGIKQISYKGLLTKEELDNYEIDNKDPEIITNFKNQDKTELNNIINN
ncbi:MAG: hypothetical protein PHN22_05075 [Candidatus ainarchaeum sp.]|nr:hypothetical protein [Candidatus ainarchaeum sp.]